MRLEQTLQAIETEKMSLPQIVNEAKEGRFTFPGQEMQAVVEKLLEVYPDNPEEIADVALHSGADTTALRVYEDNGLYEMAVTLAEEKGIGDPNRLRDKAILHYEDGMMFVQAAELAEEYRFKGRAVTNYVRANDPENALRLCAELNDVDRGLEICENAQLFDRGAEFALKAGRIETALFYAERHAYTARTFDLARTIATEHGLTDRVATYDHREHMLKKE
ncbi:MAG: hypothetical protein ACMXYE_04625 [Candidatus Woesearchaeota archaeon]